LLAGERGRPIGVPSIRDRDDVDEGIDRLEHS
jgi:hypothetical protein